MSPHHEINTKYSYYALARVLLVFPMIMVGGSLFGKYIEHRFGFDSPLYFLVSVLLVSMIGWLYVALEYKKIKDVWTQNKPHQQ